MFFFDLVGGRLGGGFCPYPEIPKHTVNIQVERVKPICIVRETTPPLPSLTDNEYCCYDSHHSVAFNLLTILHIIYRVSNGSQFIIIKIIT